jgi:hypothetical protein
MSRTLLLSFAFIGLLLFAVGLLVGEQVQRSKFDRYLQPTTATSMQIKLIQANLDVIRASVPASDDGITAPTVHYEPQCKCFEATATVLHDDLMKRPLEGVRLALTIPAVVTRFQLKAEFPEMSDWTVGVPDADFRMTFWQLNKDSSRTVLAELADGKLVFK